MIRLLLLLIAFPLMAAEPFHPTHIPGMLFWVHPETISIKEGGSVTNWLDGSGRGSHLKSAGKAPVLHHNMVNSYPALWFGGAFATNEVHARSGQLTAITVVSVTSVDGKTWHVDSSHNLPASFQGWVAELVCFNGSPDTLKLEAHLKNKYAITP